MRKPRISTLVVYISIYTIFAIICYLYGGIYPFLVAMLMVPIGFHKHFQNMEIWEDWVMSELPWDEFCTTINRDPKSKWD